MEQRNIVVLAHPDWLEGYETNTKELVQKFIREHNVLFVQAPVSRTHTLSNTKHPAIKKRISVLKREVEPLIQLQKKLWMYYPDFKEEPLGLAFNTWSYNYINKLNSQRLAKAILKVTKKIGFEDFVLFNDRNPLLGMHLKELLDPTKYIYYLSHCTFSEINENLAAKQEEKLLKKADTIITNSRYYEYYAKKINSQTFYVGQGHTEVNKDKLFKQNKLRKLVGNHLPIIGTRARTYPENMDIAILKEMLIERPNWNFILLSQNAAQYDFYQNSGLAEFSNFTTVHCQSEVEKNTYLQEVDVCLLPEVLNEDNIGKYPANLDTLLSLGKAVVATRHIANELFSEHVYMASTAEEFIVKAEHALAEDNDRLKRERIAFAGMHNWENTISAIYHSIGFGEKDTLVA